jgi:hypothetical protein
MSSSTNTRSVALKSRIVQDPKVKSGNSNAKSCNEEEIQKKKRRSAPVERNTVQSSKARNEDSKVESGIEEEIQKKKRRSAPTVERNTVQSPKARNEDSKVGSGNEDEIRSSSGDADSEDSEISRLAESLFPKNPKAANETYGNGNKKAANTNKQKKNSKSKPKTKTNKKSFGGVNPRQKEDRDDDEENDEDEEETTHITLQISYGVVNVKGNIYASKSTRPNSPTTHLPRTHRVKVPVTPGEIECNLKDLLSKAPFHCISSEEEYIPGSYVMSLIKITETYSSSRGSLILFHLKQI